MKSIPKVLNSDIPDAERLRTFQRKLYQKAREEPNFRFYMLYDKIFIPYILREAYKRCRKNGGSPGIDNLSFEDIEKSGLKEYLEELRTDLLKKTYKPSMVKRVEIPKANGKTREPGIPTIRDRIVQMACKLVIEPIFEADFKAESHGFRPKRSAKDAIKIVLSNLKEGYTEVFDADLSAFFDTIPHKELLCLVGKRISDKYVLHLIKMWLKTPVFEDGSPKGGKKNKTGTPQGGVISPLLANIYLNLMDAIITKPGGYFQRFGVKLVRYADDFILMTKVKEAEMISGIKRLINRMGLALNTEKSRYVTATDEAFDFLGFTFRYDIDLFGSKDKKYWNIFPGKKAEQSYRNKIRRYIKRHSHVSPVIISEDINAITRGWVNYFHIPGVSYAMKSVRSLRYYLLNKLQRLYFRKSQRKSRLYRKGAYKTLVSNSGLVDPIDWLKS